MKSQKTLKIFTQPSCAACPEAKELGKKLEDKVNVEYYDISEPKGLSEATFYGIMATPTLILVENKNLRQASKNLDSRDARIKHKIKKAWTGTPEQDEVLKVLGDEK